MIPTHALPPLSYFVPEHLARRVEVGSVVSAPLSGRLRPGVVVGVEDPGERATETLKSLGSLAEDLRLPAETVRLCEWAAEHSAVSLASALRAAFPPGIETNRYRVTRPAPGWKWRVGDVAGRLAVKRFLGDEGLKAAEADGRIELSLRLPTARSEEWATVENGSGPNFGRAHSQRRLFEALRSLGGDARVSELLSEVGVSRGVLRSLASRGAVSLEARLSKVSVVLSGGGEFSEAGSDADIESGVSSAIGRRGASLWRTPSREFAEVVSETAKAAMEAGKTLLVLAPEIRQVKDLVDHLKRSLPKGSRLAAYHGEIGRERAEVWRAAGLGGVDVLIGTRTAALVPVARLGAICVVDEPNEAHRAEPGYEGLPIHVRDLALRRVETEDCAVIFLSPTPSLRLYASSEVYEIPARSARVWPSARLIDMRGSGARLSSTLVHACRDALEAGEKVGVVVDRLGYATSISCLSCGDVRSCPNCDIPLALRDRRRVLVCGHCGHSERHVSDCRSCGSSRLAPTGMAVESVREELSEALEGEEVGLLTAGEREFEDARITVGTARPMLARDWDAIVLPDADAFLSGSWMGSVERAFRTFYGAAESARGLLVAQTRNPEHYALQAALREDYRAFAAAEVPRLRKLGYPPFSHLASLVIRGKEEAVLRAVKSRLLPVLELDDIEVSEPVPVAGSRATEWRVLLRSRRREVVARAGNVAARRLSKRRGAELTVKVEVDPEEV